MSKDKETKQVEVPWVQTPRGRLERGRPAPAVRAAKPVQLQPAIFPVGTYGERGVGSIGELVTRALSHFQEDYPGWEIAALCMNKINCFCLQMSARPDAPYFGIPLKEEESLKDYQVQVIGSAPRAKACV